MTSKLDPQELERLSKAATQGVWRYRPDQYDDWGIVKSPVAPDGFACVLAQFRDPDALDNETLARHREAKTDPWEANARFVTALVNAYRTGQLVPAMPSGDVVEAVVMSLAEFECANWDAQSFNDTPTGETPDEMRRGYLAKATAAITAYEAVSGVAKMREAVIGMKKHADIFDSGKHQANRLAFDEFARAALGEK